METISFWFKGLIGGDISNNYESVVHKFDFGFWKIHKAVHISSKRKVSLWTIDYPVLKAKERNTKERHRFLEHMINCLKNQQKMDHPNILKIYEFNSSPKSIMFSSDCVKYLINEESKFTKDEAILFSRQLAAAMVNLHENMHIAFLGISPETIVIGKDLSLKLALFFNSAPIKEGNAPLTHPFSPWTPSMYHLAANNISPEILNNVNITKKADVFMYALLIVFFFTEKNAFTAKDKSDYKIESVKSNIHLLPEEFQDLVDSCLSQYPSDRPPFPEILSAPAFSSTVSDVFAYITEIDHKEPKDVFSFFTGLSEILPAFSQRVTQRLFIPLFVKMILKDIRYGIVLIQMIFKVCEELSDKKFLSIVLEPLKSIINNPTNNQVEKLLLSNIEKLSKRIQIEQYDDYVYPLLFNSLQSQSTDISKMAIVKINVFLQFMSADILMNQFIPIIVQFIGISQSSAVVSELLHCIIECQSKVNGDFLATSLIPKLSETWRKNEWVDYAGDIYSFLSRLECSDENISLHVIPYASLILSRTNVNKKTQKELILLVLQNLHRIAEVRQISLEPDSNQKPAPESTEKPKKRRSSNPFDSGYEENTINQASNEKDIPDSVLPTRETINVSESKSIEQSVSQNQSNISKSNQTKTSTSEDIKDKAGKKDSIIQPKESSDDQMTVIKQPSGDQWSGFNQTIPAQDTIKQPKSNQLSDFNPQPKQPSGDQWSGFNQTMPAQETIKQPKNNQWSDFNPQPKQPSGDQWSGFNQTIPAQETIKQPKNNQWSDFNPQPKQPSGDQWSGFNQTMPQQETYQQPKNNQWSDFNPQPKQPSGDQWSGFNQTMPQQETYQQPKNNQWSDFNPQPKQPSGDQWSGFNQTMPQQETYQQPKNNQWSDFNPQPKQSSGDQWSDMNHFNTSTIKHQRANDQIQTNSNSFEFDDNNEPQPDPTANQFQFDYQAPTSKPKKNDNFNSFVFEDEAPVPTKPKPKIPNNDWDFL